MSGGGLRSHHRRLAPSTCPHTPADFARTNFRPGVGPGPDCPLCEHEEGVRELKERWAAKYPTTTQEDPPF